MSADNDQRSLDDGIRALVAQAVGDAPPAPPAPQVDATRLRSVAVVSTPTRPSSSRRALAGVVSVAAVIAVLWIVVAHAGTPTTVTDLPEDTTSDAAVEPTEVSIAPTPEWPADVAVIVASERGIERVAAPNGAPEVTRLYSDKAVQRAFELADGSYVFLALDGTVSRMWPAAADGTGFSSDGTNDAVGSIVVDGAAKVVTVAKGVTSLDDAQLDVDGNLDLIFRTLASSTDAPTQALTVWRPPAEPMTIPLPGGWAVGYGRFDFVEDDTVASGWVDDTLQYGVAAFDASGARTDRFDIFFGRGEIGRRDVVGDITGATGLLSDTTFDVQTSAYRPIELSLSPAGGEIDLQGATVVIDRPEGADTMVDLRSRAEFPVPVADGVTTVSQRTFAKGNVPNEAGSTIDAALVSDCMAFGTPLDEPLSSKVVVGLPGLRDVDPGHVSAEAIEMGGRPAVLSSYSNGALSVELAPPYWCGFGWLTTTAATRDEFVDWLRRVTVTENLPADMPPVAIASSRGVSLITARGTTVVSTESAQRAVVLGDFDVVFSQGALVYRWDHDTGVTEEMWPALSFAERPIIHDTYQGRLVFSVGDQVYVEDPINGVRVALDSDSRISVSDDGVVFGGSGLVAFTPEAALPGWVAEANSRNWVVDGSEGATTCCVAWHDDLHFTLADRAGVVLWDRMTTPMAPILGVDIHGDWVAWEVMTPGTGATSPWEAENSVWLINRATGEALALFGIDWVSIAD